MAASNNIKNIWYGIKKKHTLTMGILGKIVPKHDQSNDTHFFGCFRFNIDITLKLSKFRMKKYVSKKKTQNYFQNEI